MSRTTIEELISQMDTIPFLFIGSGFSRRYYGLPDWNGLLKHMIKQICSDEFAFQSYVSKAELKDKKYGLYPAIATVLEADFNKKWFEDPFIRCVDEYYMQKIKDGCSPFKAETAQFIKSNSVLKETFRDEVKLFGHISKKSVAGIITTNYDMFFEKYLSGYKVFIGQNELLFSQLQGVAEVYKIHGSVLNPQSIVINENDYKEFKEHKEYLAAKLLTIFMEYPIVFIGYSLSDSNIIDILSSIVKCMDNDKLNKLKDKFIFVDYKENYKGYDIDDYTTTFQNGKMISMKKITLSDYSIIFNALEKRHLTDDGKSLGAVNEMMTEVSSMIQTTRGIGTRYIQGYLDFLLLKKQAKYTFKRKEMASEILRMMMDTEAFSNEMVRATPMPISLKEAYYEYRYGIFAE